MYSPEFMRFLINYQKPDYTPVRKQVINFKFKSGRGKLAPVFLINKK